jgi:hypothetical protein
MRLRAFIFCGVHPQDSPGRWVPQIPQTIQTMNLLPMVFGQWHVSPIVLLQNLATPSVSLKHVQGD